SGHELYATCEEEIGAADAWLDRVGLSTLLDEAVTAYEAGGKSAVDATLDKVFDRFVDVWQVEANVKTYGEAVLEVMRFRKSEGQELAMTEAQWLSFAAGASFYAAREKARA